MRRRSVIVLVSCVVCGALSPAALGGPLTPPPGAPVPTAKPLSEIEPRIAVNATNTPGDAGNVFRITQSGSYYLTGNVVGEAGKNGILIAARNVTLDLNGFAVIGATGAINGISTTSTAAFVIVRNGTVSGWPVSGVSISSASGGIVENIVSAENQFLGFSLSANAVAVHCVAAANQNSGFLAGTNAVITACTSRDNGAIGFSTGNGAVITNCSARDNGSNGFQIGSGSLVRSSAAIGNAANGIQTSSRCLVESNAVVQNGVHGILTGLACRIVGNNASGNGTIVTDGAGISDTFGSSVIDSNTCQGNDFGIRVSTNGSVIIRNFCGDNTTNFFIGNGRNTWARVVDVTAGFPFTVNGNSDVGVIDSTQGLANFAY